MVFQSTYCNYGHRLSDGKPVDHECCVLPPAALQAERDDDYDRAIELLEAAKPLRPHRGISCTTAEGSHGKAR